MHIYSVFDPEFRPYGQVIRQVDFTPLLAPLAGQPKPEEGTVYVPSCPALETQAVMALVQGQLYGGMPVQIGYCNGTNTRLNCLEYHRDSEINLPQEDIILLLAHRWQVEEGTLDTGAVKAFRVPGGTAVELYATTLHYAPCDSCPGAGFRVAVVLPRGTNLPLEGARTPCCPEDGQLWARNKWLLAHPAAPEAAQGAWVGLRGENLDIEPWIKGEN